ncbi:uncharacterized protein LOC142861050 [Microcebus murinus]|uniref:uncharacterized protein LOC142861050 n=1 Tax=Microcebus murinus TaxID=30608 RepID=UPI003F6AD356
MAMTPEQQSAYIAQQMSQFQAVQEQVTSKCSQTKASPSSSQHMMPPQTGLLQKNLSPGMIPPTRHQSHEDAGMISPTTGKQRGIFNSSPQFPIPTRSGQNLLSSLGSVCRHMQNPKANPPGVPLPGFCPSLLGRQALSPHQLRQPSVPTMPTVFNNAGWVAVAAAVTTAVLREPHPNQADNSIQQHFDSNLIFAKAPMRVPSIAPAFLSQQAVVPPNQMALGGRPGQKLSPALANSSFSLLGNQSLRQSPVRGPVPVLSTTKSLQQGMASFHPMSPIQGIEPPSYMAAAAAAAADSAITASQFPSPFNRMSTPLELPPNNVLLQPQLPLCDLISPPNCSEVDFIEGLLKGSSVSPGEDWVYNLRLIDDILEQHAAAPNATAQNAGQLPQNAGEL